MGKEYEKQLLSFILLHVIPHLELYFLKFQYNDAEIPYPVHENSFPDFAWKQECVLIPGKAADNSGCSIGKRKVFMCWRF